MHEGTDIAIPKGGAVGANVTGTVVYAGYGAQGSGYGGYGNTVAVRDKDGNVHVYGHLDSVNVKQGQKISLNSLLGRAGNTGDSRGVHLHYEVRKGGQLHNTLNPRNYFG